MLISQINNGFGSAAVVVRNTPDEEARFVKDAPSVYALAMEAADSRRSLMEVIAQHGLGDYSIDLMRVHAEGRFLLPIMHPDPSHLHLTGTGLTHLGSAATRDSMHKKAAQSEEENLTDSMKMFRMGLEGGKPKAGEKGVQPEWFYKGNGTQAVASGQPLTSPSFALDGGEEPEIAGIYVINKDGQPFRVGFALSNEFSDHVTERINYLYLAHSKLRQASFGPEIWVGEPPEDIQGTSRIRRGGQTIFEKPFLSGETNMSHTFANLEYHHFKYKLFREPGDVHVHMFGTATLSFAEGIKPQQGDIFEIEVPEFGYPLRNSLQVAEEENIAVSML
jgi:hypothetical protein